MSAGPPSVISILAPLPVFTFAAAFCGDEFAVFEGEFFGSAAEQEHRMPKNIAGSRRQSFFIFWRLTVGSKVKEKRHAFESL